MKKSQSSKLNMLLAVQLLLNAKQLIWQVIAAFGPAFAELQAIIQSILSAEARQQKLSHGYVVEKLNRKITMAQQANRIRSAVQAYATDVSDAPLFGRVNFSMSKIRYAGSNTARTRAQVICNEANAIAGNLTNYGVTAQDIIDLQAAIDNFAAYISMPKDVIAEVETATTDLKTYFKQVNPVLKNKLDKLMQNFKTSAPQFYEQYFNDRKIYDGKTNYTEFKLMVIDSLMQQPLEGVSIEAVGTHKTYNFMTDMTGNATERVMPGFYNFTFTKRLSKNDFQKILCH